MSGTDVRARGSEPGLTRAGGQDDVRTVLLLVLLPAVVPQNLDNSFSFHPCVFRLTRLRRPVLVHGMVVFNLLGHIDINAQQNDDAICQDVVLAIPRDHNFRSAACFSFLYQANLVVSLPSPQLSNKKKMCDPPSMDHLYPSTYLRLFHGMVVSLMNHTFASHFKHYIFRGEGERKGEKGIERAKPISSRYVHL